MCASEMMQPSEMMAWRSVAPLILLPGQKTRVGVDRGCGVEETVLRHQIGQIEIRFVKGANRSDVLPVALEDVAADLPLLDRLRE